MSSYATWCVITKIRQRCLASSWKACRRNGPASYVVKSSWKLFGSWSGHIVCPRDQIAVIVEELTQTEGLIIESDEDVIQAAMGYRQGSADFSDFMILIAAQRVGAEPLYTFDRKFSRLAGTELLEASQKDDSQ